MLILLGIWMKVRNLCLVNNIKENKLINPNEAEMYKSYLCIYDGEQMMGFKDEEGCWWAYTALGFNKIFIIDKPLLVK